MDRVHIQKKFGRFGIKVYNILIGFYVIKFFYNDIRIIHSVRVKITLCHAYIFYHRILYDHDR